MRILALAMLTVSAYGGACYISGTGSDSNSGLSENAAFRTIQAAANRTQPGDVVYVMNGVYTTCTGCNVLDITVQIHIGAGRNAIGIHRGASDIEESGFDVQGNRRNVTLVEYAAQAQKWRWIPFTRYFYQPKALRTFEEICARILAVEKDAEGLLEEIVEGAAT